MEFRTYGLPEEVVTLVTRDAVGCLCQGSRAPPDFSGSTWTVVTVENNWIQGEAALA